MKLAIHLIILFCVCSTSFGQNKGMTFQEAEIMGTPVSHLDSIYKSALHSDSSLAVFKTEKEQQAMMDAYVKLLQDLGKYLSDNNFEWEKPTRCYNRIYFNTDGTIDYFLFNFLGKNEEVPSEENQKVFRQLLNEFITDYQIEPRASTKFAQCSPTTYKPSK